VGATPGQLTQADQRDIHVTSLCAVGLGAPQRNWGTASPKQLRLRDWLGIPLLLAEGNDLRTIWLGCFLLRLSFTG